MRILAIWDTNNDTATKHIETRSDLKTAKHRGRKPNRMIVHQLDMKEVSEKELRKSVSRTGVIMVVGGEKPKCIYDGRKRTR